MVCAYTCTVITYMSCDSTITTGFSIRLLTMVVANSSNPTRYDSFDSFQGLALAKTAASLGCHSVRGIVKQSSSSLDNSLQQNGHFVEPVAASTWQNQDPHNYRQQITACNLPKECFSSKVHAGVTDTCQVGWRNVGIVLLQNLHHQPVSIAGSKMDRLVAQTICTGRSCLKISQKHFCEMPVPWTQDLPVKYGN